MSSITLTPQMLAVLDAATVARLQALVAMAAPVASPAVSEPQALMLEPAAEMKVKKTLSPEHLAKMKAGREAAKLKKQLEATASLAPVAALEAADTLVSVGALEAAPVAEWTARVEAALEAEVVASLAARGVTAVEADWGPEVRAALAAPVLTMKGNKKTSKPSAWSDWVKKIMAERKDEIAAHKEAAEWKAGAHLKWLAANAGKTSPEWLAFKAAWTLEHAQAQPQQAPPVSAAASDDEAPVAAVGGGGSVAAAAAVAAPAPAPVKRGPKPMVEMSADELKAFLEAKKAKKAKKAATAAATATATAATAAAAADAETEPDEPEPVVTPPIAKKRGPKPLATMTADERAAHDAKVAERKMAKEAKARAADAALALVAQMQAAH